METGGGWVGDHIGPGSPRADAWDRKEPNNTDGVSGGTLRSDSIMGESMGPCRGQDNAGGFKSVSHPVPECLHEADASLNGIHGYRKEHSRSRQIDSLGFLPFVFYLVHP